MDDAPVGACVDGGWLGRLEDEPSPPPPDPPRNMERFATFTAPVASIPPTKPPVPPPPPMFAVTGTRNFTSAGSATIARIRKIIPIRNFPISSLNE